MLSSQLVPKKKRKRNPVQARWFGDGGGCVVATGGKLELGGPVARWRSHSDTSKMTPLIGTSYFAVM